MLLDAAKPLYLIGLSQLSLSNLLQYPQLGSLLLLLLLLGVLTLEWQVLLLPSPSLTLMDSPSLKPRHCSLLHMLSLRSLLQLLSLLLSKL